MVGIQFSVSIHNPQRRPLKERLRLPSEGKGGGGWVHPIMDYKGRGTFFRREVYTEGRDFTS